MVMEDPLTWIFVVTVALATALALIAVRGNLSIVGTGRRARVDRDAVADLL